MIILSMEARSLGRPAKPDSGHAVWPEGTKLRLESIFSAWNLYSIIAISVSYPLLPHKSAHGIKRQKCARVFEKNSDVF